MDFEYVQKVQEWVELDNRILRNKEAIKDVVEKKSSLETEILSYIEKNKIDDLTLNISDGNIKFAKRNTMQHLSIKVIKEILEKYVVEKGVELNVEEIGNFISSNLEKKSSVFMKRNIR